MINAVLSLSILGLSFHSSLSKMTPNSICPMVPTCKNFDAFRFQGSWFVHGMFYSPLPEVPDGERTCGIITYSVDYGGKINIVEEKFDIESSTARVKDMQGVIPDSADASKWEVSSSDTGGIGDYWILDTDYVNYAVPLLCQSLSGQRGLSAWIMTRERYPSKSVVNTAFFSVYEHGLGRNNFTLFNKALC